MKKLLLTLGSMSAVAIPVVSVVSCGDSKPTVTNAEATTPAIIQQQATFTPLSAIKSISYTKDSYHNYEAIIKALTPFIKWDANEKIVHIDESTPEHAVFVFTEDKIVLGANVAVSHLVTMNINTGKIISIIDNSNHSIAQEEISQANAYDEGFDAETHKVTYEEAILAMARIIKEVGESSSVTCSKEKFESIEGTGMSIYDVNLAAIIDIPSYINVLVSKTKGSNTLHYSISFAEGLRGMSDISVEIE